MIIRNCAGGVVFRDDKVFVLKNDKNEWVLPKGKIRGEQLPPETAINRVEYETGVNAPKIVSSAGETAYEFYSFSRNQAVCNKIIWYIMESQDEEYKVNLEEGFKEGGFYPVEEAVDMITYSQDKSLVSLAYKRYLEFKDYQEKLNYA
ncbi:8-oxo-dGTP pyrophosphatase MutT, NUDIX family [Tissierella praeacuta DSM 18095]|uniref:8-oxo-dGTP pyrophosphatase MutT, NUDIX family n=1 Tax=Tissierella praeacuta DSM 18095 TaxID=1123404 RepID=A0A1M4SWV3_9FIRM|nr:NUDIX hydrolase [Tissierella praeacuta]SHE36639.1 8-oxo-dGTP pyrophosphatase MutT, NUDIX family [Tissierella praeacuta DSM 18095]SUP01843.1 NUDIX domain [Tissierella praeacuta]